MTDKFNSKAIGLDVGLLIGKFFMSTEELHYGYWPDDKTVTAQNFSQAQDRHSQLIIDNIPKTVKHILDVGSGSGILICEFAKKVLPNQKSRALMRVMFCCLDLRNYIHIDSLS